MAGHGDGGGGGGGEYRRGGEEREAVGGGRARVVESGRALDCDLGGRAGAPAPKGKVYSANCGYDAPVQRPCTVLGRSGQRDECTYTVPHINNGACERVSVLQSKRGSCEPVKMYLWHCATFAGSNRYPSLLPPLPRPCLCAFCTGGLCYAVWLGLVSLRDRQTSQRRSNGVRSGVLYLTAPSRKVVVCGGVSAWAA